MKLSSFRLTSGLLLRIQTVLSGVHLFRQLSILEFKTLNNFSGLICLQKDCQLRLVRAVLNSYSEYFDLS